MDTDAIVSALTQEHEGYARRLAHASERGDKAAADAMKERMELVEKELARHGGPSATAERRPRKPRETR